MPEVLLPSIAKTSPCLSAILRSEPIFPSYSSAFAYNHSPAASNMIFFANSALPDRFIVIRNGAKLPNDDVRAFARSRPTQLPRICYRKRTNTVALVQNRQPNVLPSRLMCSLVALKLNRTSTASSLFSLPCID